MSGSLAWLLGLLLTAAAVTLVLNLLQAKRVNTGLVESLADSQEQLRAALDSTQECARQLERRNAETKNKVTLHTPHVVEITSLHSGARQARHIYLVRGMDVKMAAACRTCSWPGWRGTWTMPRARRGKRWTGWKGD